MDEAAQERHPSLLDFNNLLRTGTLLTLPFANITRFYCPPPPKPSRLPCQFQARQISWASRSLLGLAPVHRTHTRRRSTPTGLGLLGPEALWKQ